MRQPRYAYLQRVRNRLLEPCFDINGAAADGVRGPTLCIVRSPPPPEPSLACERSLALMLIISSPLLSTTTNSRSLRSSPFEEWTHVASPFPFAYTRSESTPLIARRNFRGNVGARSRSRE